MIPSERHAPRHRKEVASLWHGNAIFSKKLLDLSAIGGRQSELRVRKEISLTIRVRRIHGVVFARRALKVSALRRA
jgi:hypothetical protein